MLVILKGALASNWKDEGIDPAKPTTTKKASVTFAAKLTLDGVIYLRSATGTLKQSAKASQFHTLHAQPIIPR